MKKGGRPTKSLAEKRKYRLSLKLNTVEYFELKKKARIASKNRCEILREFILKGEIQQRISPGELHLQKQLAGMANNLNQLTRLAHLQGVNSLKSISEKLLAEIDEILKQNRV